MRGFRENHIYSLVKLNYCFVEILDQDFKPLSAMFLVNK